MSEHYTQEQRDSTTATNNIPTKLNKKVKNYFEQKYNATPVKVRSGASKDQAIKQTTSTTVKKEQGKTLTASVPSAKKVVHVKTVKEEVVETPVETKPKRSSKKGTVNVVVKDAVARDTSTKDTVSRDNNSKDKHTQHKQQTQSEQELLNVQNVKEGSDKNDFTSNRLINIKSPNKTFKANNDKTDAANVDRSKTTLLATNINKSSQKGVGGSSSNNHTGIAFNDGVVSEQSRSTVNNKANSSSQQIKAMVQDTISKSNIEQFKSTHFTLEATKYNNTVKNGNYYAHDMNGMLIRKNENNSSKTPYGWILIDGKPINIHTDLYDTSLTHTLKKLKALQPNLFKKPSGTLYRAYKDIGEQFGINILTI